MTLLILKLNWFSGVLCLAALLGVVIYYFNWKSPADKFKQRMAYISYCIKNITVDETNFDYIDDLFRDLYIYDPTLEDQERVKFLFDDFLKQFDEFNRYKVEENNLKP